jgi:hypothetical protein
MKLFSARHASMVGAVAFAALALFSWPGCGTECSGGVFVDGVCEGRCDPGSCLEGNVCVGNRCMLTCTSHNDCFSPSKGQAPYQACQVQKTDAVPAEDDPNAGLNAGPDAYVCTTIDKSGGIGVLCPFGTECDAAFACPDGTGCEAGKGSEGHCTAEECKALECISKGEADAEAYCATVDCKADADCGPGYYCGIERLPTKICGTEKGTEEPCIDPSTFTANGGTYQEGPGSLLRNVCLKREPCAPCADQYDCSLSDDLACVTIESAQVCAKTCAGDVDCPDDFQCTGGFCVPRSGTCKPPADNNYCYNCLNDLDCGPAGPDSTVVCADLSAGQKGCFDPATLDIDCTMDSDCPASPSGKFGECLDEDEGLVGGAQAKLTGTVALTSITLSDLTGTTLIIDEDAAGSPQTVTFTLPADVADIRNQVDAQTDDKVLVSIVSDRLVLTSTVTGVEIRDGVPGAMRVTTGTANPILGFSNNKSNTGTAADDVYFKCYLPFFPTPNKFQCWSP